MLLFILLRNVKYCYVYIWIVKKINSLTVFLGLIWSSEACPLLSEEELALCWCSCEPLLPRLPYPCELPAWTGCTRTLWIRSFSCGTSGDMVLTSPSSRAVNTSSFSGLLQKGRDGRQVLWDHFRGWLDHSWSVRISTYAIHGLIAKFHYNRVKHVYTFKLF